MLRDITLGQYYQADSIIHRLDPRTKIMATIGYIVSLFLVNNIIGYAVCILFLAGMIMLSHVPFKFMVRGLKAVIVLLLMTVVFNLFLTQGESLWSFWIFNITKEGLRSAVFMAMRLFLLIIGSSLMTLTTTPNNLTDGIESLLSFLKIFRVPVHEVAMMMSIALRFIPILVDETNKIMKAQMARGANFETGGLIKKAKAMVPLFVPLFISAFRRANDLAMAMEARCYHGGKGRTKMKPLHYHLRDLWGYIIIACEITAAVFAGMIPFAIWIF